MSKPVNFASPEGSRTGHGIGIALVLASAAFFSLSGVFTKSIKVDLWTIACWRGLIGAILITAYVAIRPVISGEPADFRLGWRGWVLASVGSAGTL
ncbi:MAG: EamA family transporter, partial [Pseudomonadota bacterium]